MYQQRTLHSTLLNLILIRVCTLNNVLSPYSFLCIKIYSFGIFPCKKYKDASTTVTPASLPVRSLGNAAKPAASKSASRPVSRFISFTFTKKALARSSSSILRIPVPSMSHFPAWATFHNPFSPDVLNPTAKNRGKMIANLERDPWIVPSSKKRLEKMAYPAATL